MNDIANRISQAPGSVRAGDTHRLTVHGAEPETAIGRLVSVLDVDAGAGLVSVILTHTDLEIRTDLDVMVSGHELGLPFALAFQTDLVGPVGIVSLSGEALGRVSEQMCDLRDAVDMGQSPASLLGRVGMPLRGRQDARWEWKVGEGAVLDRALAAHAPAMKD